MKVNAQQAKLISKQIKRPTMRHSENCVSCFSETDISELNITTGQCQMCKKSLISKNDFTKMLNLSDEILKKIKGDK